MEGGKYEIERSNKRIDVFGYDQSFDDDDIKSLWEEHKIMYQYGGVMAVWIEDRGMIPPLAHLMQEDDGHIFWSKDRDVAFDVGWLDNYIETLTGLKKKLSRKGVAHGKD